MDLPLYIFSIVAFLLAPRALGKWRWLLPAGFVCLNLFLFLGPESLQPRTNPVVYFLLSQASWFLFGLDLVFHGKASRIVAQVPLRSWILWPMFRLMGIGCIFVAYAGDLPPEFALKTAFGDVVTALGAGMLWLFYRPQNIWYRGLLLFWNAYGFVTVLAASVGLLRVSPSSFDAHVYFTEFPQVWIPLFWMPLGVIIHCAIFFKMFTVEEVSTT